MPVAVLRVVHVRMYVHQWLVAVAVRMRDLRQLLRRVFVLMVLVVLVPVRVFQGFVRVLVFVPVR